MKNYQNEFKNIMNSVHKYFLKKFVLFSFSIIHRDNRLYA